MQILRLVGLVGNGYGLPSRGSTFQMTRTGGQSSEIDLPGRIMHEHHFGQNLTAREGKTGLAHAYHSSVTPGRRKHRDLCSIPRQPRSIRSLPKEVDLTFRMARNKASPQLSQSLTKKNISLTPERPRLEGNTMSKNSTPPVTNAGPRSDSRCAVRPGGPRHQKVAISHRRRHESVDRPPICECASGARLE